MNHLTTAHLCSGYDGLGMALRQLGDVTTLWHAEIDPDMSTVLVKREPGVLNVGDLIRVTVERHWRNAPVPDVLSAGFPCQPVSGAGKMLAELDPRWLWPFIIEAVRVIRPAYLLLENVLNIVSIQGGAILRGILDDLCAAGYAVRWTTLGACAVGAPHHRHRWFLWAVRTSGPAPAAVRVGPEYVLWRAPLWRPCSTAKSNSERPVWRRSLAGQNRWRKSAHGCLPAPHGARQRLARGRLRGHAEHRGGAVAAHASGYRWRQRWSESARLPR